MDASEGKTKTSRHVRSAALGIALGSSAGFWADVCSNGFPQYGPGAAFALIAAILILLYVAAVLPKIPSRSDDERAELWLERERWLLHYAESDMDLPSPPEIDPANYRIDSAGWKELALPDGTRVKTNPEGDVWEVPDGPFKGEQHFTLDAALRETAKAGKRMPTESEWQRVLYRVAVELDGKSGRIDGYGIAENLGLPLTGYRCPFGSCCYGQAWCGYYWASPTASENVAYGLFSDVSARIFSVKGEDADELRPFGFSVRCLKD